MTNDSSNTTTSAPSRADSARPSAAAGSQDERKRAGVTWSDLTVDAILVHLRSVLHGLRTKGVPVTLVRTETGITITITLAKLAKPAAVTKPVTTAEQPAPATTAG